MKFKSVATDCQQIQSLIKSFQSIAKFGDKFYVRLSSNQMRLIVNQCQPSAPFLVKCDLNSEDYFQEYVFRGKSNENNFIYFEMRSESVLQVFNSLLVNIKTLTMRLTNRCDDEVLAISVDYPTQDTDRCVRHDIKVDIVRAQHWSSIDETDETSYELSLYCPDSRLIGSVIEKFNDLSEFMLIKAKAVDDIKGVMIVGVKSESITIKTKYEELDLCPNDSIGSNSSQGNSWVSVQVSVKKLYLIFNTLKHLRPTSISCHIRDKTRIYFQFFHNFVNFQVFLTNFEIEI